MPSSLEAYRVFIASPGGLKAMRDCFRSTVENYNEADAVRRGAIFIPVGWEATLGGMGRPQEIINDDLSECDYCIVVLHDRWGTPASTAPDAKTGTEEEYALALELREGAAEFIQEIELVFMWGDRWKMMHSGTQPKKGLELQP